MDKRSAWQASGGMTPPNVWTLTLDRYERDNLLQLIQAVMSGDGRAVGAFNTGDWVGQIRWRLGRKDTSAHGPGVQAVYEIDDNDHPLAARPVNEERP